MGVRIVAMQTHAWSLKVPRKMGVKYLFYGAMSPIWGQVPALWRVPV